MYSALIQVITPLLFILTVIASSEGVYFIDDTDPSINWNGPFLALDSNFSPITWANASECFNKTYHVGTGLTIDGHSFDIPFTGSGISLFVAYDNRLGLNVSVTLDNNFTTINWFILDNDPVSPTYTSYNATLYDNQNLTYGNHNLNVILQDYNGLDSVIMFDYAAVTGTRVTNISSGSNSGKKIGAGIGGGLGALAVFVAVAFIFILSRRRTRRKTSAMELNLIDPDAKDPSMFHQTSSHTSSTFRPGHNRHQSSFSQSSASPISPMKPIYSKIFGQEHPFRKLPS